MSELEQLERESWAFIRNSTPWLSEAKLYREEIFLAFNSVSQQGSLKEIISFQENSTPLESDIFFLENLVKMRIQLLPTTEGTIIKIAFHSITEPGKLPPPFYVVQVVDGVFSDNRGRYNSHGLETATRTALAFAYYKYCNDHLQTALK